MDKGRKTASHHIEAAHEALTLALESLALGDPIVWPLQQQIDILAMLMEGLEQVAELEAAGDTPETKPEPSLGPKRLGHTKAANIHNRILRTY